mmetsp:Transcript_22715/g.60791  ORF Transcript_22715/g.60791 Transcript_22715/m.60791 type:complete len:272 (-) Transcript_22715:202-1017(-)
MAALARDSSRRPSIHTPLTLSFLQPESVSEILVSSCLEMSRACRISSLNKVPFMAAACRRALASVPRRARDSCSRASRRCSSSFSHALALSTCLRACTSRRVAWLSSRAKSASWLRSRSSSLLKAGSSNHCPSAPRSSSIFLPLSHCTSLLSSFSPTLSISSTARSSESPSFSMESTTFSSIISSRSSLFVSDSACLLMASIWRSVTSLSASSRMSLAASSLALAAACSAMAASLPNCLPAPLSALIDPPLMRLVMELLDWLNCLMSSGSM